VSATVQLPSAAAVLDRAPGENFPVASRLLPRGDREHLLALYGYARLVDDAGDEAPGDRMALLDEIEADLDRIYAGGAPRHALTDRLAATIEACDLPREPLQALIAANRQDQAVQRYATFADLLAYCELSANPVGRLVLHVLGAATPERIVLSDRVCTALQLAEHWQDVVEDLARGRVYLPTEDLERFGVSTGELGLSPAPERVRSLMAFQVRRARGILGQGAPLVRTLRGRPRVAVAAFVAGGRAALDAIERAGGDVSAGAPRATRAARARCLLLVLAGMRAKG
jgi:squalene synthase HpnC